MKTIPVWWAFGCKGNWDQGLTMAALAGELAPLGDVEFKDRPGALASIERQDEGAVVVLAARHITEFQDRVLRVALDLLPWALILQLGDEENGYDGWSLKAPNRKVWVQSPRPGRFDCLDRVALYGWPYGTPALAARCRDPLRTERYYLWGFEGQNNNTHRQSLKEACAVPAVLADYPGYYLETEGFSLGSPREDYMERMLQTRIILCPAGAWTPETFRFSEALECGCLPVVENTAQNGPWSALYDYWPYATAGSTVPFPVVQDWKADLPAILDRYRNNPCWLEQDTMATRAWWKAQKERYVLEMLQDVAELSRGPGLPVTERSLLASQREK